MLLKRMQGNIAAKHGRVLYYFLNIIIIYNYYNDTMYNN